MTVYIYAAKRTAVGKFNGQFSQVPAITLGKVTLQAALEQANVDGGQLDEVIFGHVLQADTGQGPIRQAMIAAGIPDSVPGFSINKLCGSGLKSVMLGAQAIRAGDAQLVAVGGMENMTRAPHLLPLARKGYRLGNAEVLDHMLRDGLWDAFEGYHMGMTAEFIADKYQISRAAQDEFSLASQQKAIHAIQSGHFVPEITPVTVADRRGDKVYTQDEHPTLDITAESLQQLKPVFKKDGTVTAGNASGINDGAAALILGIEGAASKPLAKIVAYAHGAMDPALMGLTPTIAIQNALAKTHFSLADMELVELNEAFAVQSLGVLHELKQQFAINDNWIAERVNISGGAIALGHPIGASGARILTTLLYNLQRLDKKIGMASLCIGGGMAVTVIVERC